MSIKKRQFSPCIISKVKYALELKKKKPTNDKTCSERYWNDVIDHVASTKGITDKKTIDRAKQKYNTL